jgi:hypothetical protein
MVWMVALTLLLTLLSGCAPRMAMERWIFQKPGMTEAQRKGDQRECLSQAVDPTGPLRMGEFVHLDREMYKACMQQRGYTLRIEQ